MNVLVLDGEVVAEKEGIDVWCANGWTLAPLP